MIEFLFMILAIVIAFRLFGFAFKMAWGVMKLIFVGGIVILAPLAVVLIIIYGVAVMALPVLIIGGIGYFIGKSLSQN